MLTIHRVPQGDSYFIKIPLLKDDQPWPIAGWSFWFTVKRDKDDADDDALIQKSTDDDTIRAFGVTAAYVVGLPADTKGKDTGRYFFDIQGESPEGDIYTLEEGYFDLPSETTRAA